MKIFPLKITHSNKFKIEVIPNFSESLLENPRTQKSYKSPLLILLSKMWNKTFKNFNISGECNNGRGNNNNVTQCFNCLSNINLFNPYSTPVSLVLYHPHFRDKKVETQRGYLICPSFILELLSGKPRFKSRKHETWYIIFLYILGCLKHSIIKHNF